MAYHSALLNVMVKAATKASRRLNRDFGEVEHLQVSRKGPADYVSMADKTAEKTIFYDLSEARPNFGFVMEERGTLDAAEGTDARWIIDPLDGTTNFLHGLPHFAISIACEIHGVLEAAVVYDPIRDEMFKAEKGRGAYVNERRLRVSSRAGLGESLLATGMPWKGKKGHKLCEAELSAFMPKVAGIRRFGAALLDLAYVAAGRFDGFWEHGLKLWDIAAGILIVREAGGAVTDIEGGNQMLETGNIIATNNALQSTLEKTLATVYRETQEKEKKPKKPEK